MAASLTTEAALEALRRFDLLESAMEELEKRIENQLEPALRALSGAGRSGIFRPEGGGGDPVPLWPGRRVFREMEGEGMNLDPPRWECLRL